MATRKVLGLRASPSDVRYALLEISDGDSVIFINQNDETKLQYPASHTATDEKLKWLKGELDRILRQVPNIDQVVIKTPEYAGTENRSKRDSAYAEAICILAASERNIPVCSKLYSQIHSTSSNAMRHAEERLGRTPRYWDAKIADAILAALSVR